jgi:HSP20 family protein
MRKLAVRENWFEDLFDFRRGFEQIFNRLLAGWPDTERAATMFGLMPQIEAWIDKEAKKYHLRLALPGVDPKKVDLKLQGNMLTISAESKASREAKEVDYLYREINYGTFQRTLTLPEGVDAEKISAEFNNGLLEITAPIAAAALPRRVEIKSLPKAKAA